MRWARASCVVMVAAVASAWAAAAHAAVPAVSAPDPTLRLISQSEYASTIAHIFGPDLGVKIRFAPVNRVDGLLAVGRGSSVLTSGALDPLDSTARSVAAQVVDPVHRSYLVPCAPARPEARDDQCAKRFLSTVGRLIYRRPLTDEELSQAVALAGRAVSAAGGFYPGLAYALSGMLVAPQFLYIWERSEPDPAQPGTWRLDGYSRASRLSFLLWDAAPDDELLSAAARGELYSAAGLRRQVSRMIASPLYKDGVRTFFTDFLSLEAFDTLAKDPVIYPAVTLKTIEEAREQILRNVVDHIVDRHGDYRGLFTTRHTFLSSDLAVLYRIPVDIGSQGWVPYKFPPGDARAGLLTQIGFLEQYAHPGRSSSTRRGRAIRETLLCQKVPDPPPNVDFSIIEDPHAHFHTARERLAAHQQNAVCAGCHKLTDPIGLALENFDGAGQFRSSENGAAIDPSGRLDGAAFSDAAGLGRALQDNPALRSCIVRQLYAYSAGRKVTDAEKPLLQYYESVLDARGYRFDEMLRLMILAPAFFAVGPPRLTVAANRASMEDSRHAD